MNLLNNDKSIIIKALTDAGYPEPTDIKIEETAPGAKTGILRYNPNCDQRDAELGISALEDAGLNIAYDGNPETKERGVDLDTDPISVVIMVQDPLFKPSA